MDYLRNYRKGKKNMVSEKKGKRSIKKKTSGKSDIKRYEKYTCFVVGLIIVFLLFAVIKNSVFVPAFLITIGLELFCISYYYMDDRKKKDLVYGLFGVGVLLVLIAVIYTIVKTV